MLARKEVQAHAEKLQNTDYFPRNDGGAYLTLIVDVLMQASSEIVVAMIVREWLLKHKERPTLAEIAELVSQHNSAIEPVESGYYKTPESWKRAKPSCPDCDDSGWRIVERGGYSGAERCACASQQQAPMSAEVRGPRRESPRFRTAPPQCSQPRERVAAASAVEPFRE